jgi:hypothetical protein
VKNSVQKRTLYQQGKRFQEMFQLEQSEDTQHSENLSSILVTVGSICSTNTELNVKWQDRQKIDHTNECSGVHQP